MGLGDIHEYEEFGLGPIDIIDTENKKGPFGLPAHVVYTTTEKRFYYDSGSEWILLSDLSGNAPADAVKIQGIPVDATAPTDLQTLVYDQGSNTYVPTSQDLQFIYDAGPASPTIVQDNTTGGITITSPAASTFPPIQVQSGGTAPAIDLTSNGGSTDVTIQLADGSTAPQGDPGTVRLRWNQVTGTLQASLDGGVYQNLITEMMTGISLDVAYNGGTETSGSGRIITVDAGAVRLEKVAADATNAMEIVTSAGSGLGLLISDNGISSTDTSFIETEQFGAGATANGASATSLGYNASSTTEGTALGAHTIAASQSVAVGFNAQAAGGISIGWGSSTASTGCALGVGANSAGTGISIGPSASAATASVAIGAGTVAAANQFVAGSSFGAEIRDVYFGRGVSDTANVNVTIHGTGGANPAQTGGELRLAGGLAGDAATAGGAVRIQTARAGSGTSLTDAVVISNAGSVTIPSGNLTLTSGNATVTSGNVVVSAGNVDTVGAALTVSAVQLTDFTVDGTATMWPCDATAAPFTATLVAANSVPSGKIYRFKRTNTNGNAVTIAAAGGDTIDGASTQSLSSANASLDLQSDGSSKWYILSSASASSPTWTKYTLSYTSFSAAATTNSITLFTLPAGGVIHAVKLKHSASFTGGAISAYTLQVGISGNNGKYAPPFDVFQGTSSTTYQLTADVGGEDQASTTQITITATSTTANLNAATQGSVDVWVLSSTAA